MKFSREIPGDYFNAMQYKINESERTAKASRKFKEFWYERFRYFVKYSCAPVNIRESSKSYNQRK